MALLTLKGEIAKSGLTMTQIVEDPRIDYNLGTLSLKVGGKYPFTLPEAVALKEVIGSELPLEELYKEG